MVLSGSALALSPAQNAVIALPRGPSALPVPAYNNVMTSWQKAGLAVIGGIPTRTQCGATLTPSGGDDLSQITAAIAACPTNEAVQLGAGTFSITMSEYILLDKSITLRGTGTCNNPSSPYCQTVIDVSNGQLPTYAAGGQCGTDTSHIVSCVYNPAIYVSPPAGLFDQTWSGCPTTTSATGCSTALDADASQGQTTIQVHSLTNFSVGMWIRIDEASGATTQTDPSNSSGTVFAAPDFTASSGSPATGKIAYAGAGVEIGWAYGALYDRETSEIHLISAVGAGPCPGVNCTLTFDSPLTIAYRQSGNHFAQVYWPASGSNVPISFIEKVGVENITITRATDGPINMTFCAYCWISHVEAYGWSKGIALNNVARSELIGSYIHDCYDCENNGTEYPISIDGATTESLVSNNIILLAGKGMVARSTGGGNVVSYNYQDQTFYMASVIGNYWLDQGVNGSHYVGSHHILLEGNYGTNCDDDETHGNVVYHTFFRNWCTGLRVPFNDPSFTTATSSTYNPSDAPVNDLTNTGFATGNAYPYSGGTAPHRAASTMRWDYWMAFVGNVLGEPGVTTTGNGWSYAQYTESNNNIWMLGWSGGECPGCSDENLNGTNGSYYFRHGNYDYLNNSIVDWQAGYSRTLPNSFYLSAAPAFFSSGTCTYPWPWVTPTSGTQIQTNSCRGSGLPAKARWDAGTPFVQP
jgi:hypothetical protein